MCVWSLSLVPLSCKEGKYAQFCVYTGHLGNLFLEIHNKVSLHRKNLILFFSIRNRSVSLIIDTNAYILLSKMKNFNWMKKFYVFFFAVKFSYNYFPLLVFELSVIYIVIDIGCPIRKRMEKADMI